MLVLSRRIGEEIVIGGNVRVTVLNVSGQKVRLGIMAPDFRGRASPRTACTGSSPRYRH